MKGAWGKALRAFCFPGGVMAIPLIKTARLRLRPYQAGDFPAFAALWADPGFCAQVGVPPRGESEAWSSFLRGAGQWLIEGYGQWAVAGPGDEFWGQVGFFRAYRGFGADFDPYPEAGWVLAPRYQGQGYGREAVVAALTWFDKAVGGPLVAIISQGNAPSLRLAAEMGFAVRRAVDEDSAPAFLLRRG